MKFSQCHPYSTALLANNSYSSSPNCGAANFREALDDSGIATSSLLKQYNAFNCPVDPEYKNER